MELYKNVTEVPFCLADT